MQWRVPTVAIALMLVSGAVAQAATTTAEYVAQVDPICQVGQRDMKAEAKRQNPGIKKIRRKLEGDMLSRKREKTLLGKLAAKEFAPTLKVFPRVTSQIAAVAPAPADISAVNTWLDARGTYADLIAQAVRAAKQGRTKMEVRLIQRATGTIVEGEIPVESFGFRYCILSSPRD